MYTTTLTQKGQITIPYLLRYKFGLKPGQKILFEEKEGNITMKNVPDFFSLQGSIKSKIKYSDKKADEAIGKMFQEKYGQTD